MVLGVFIGSMVLSLFSWGYPVGMIVEIMAIPFAIWNFATVVIFIIARALSGSGSPFDCGVLLPPLIGALGFSILSFFLYYNGVFPFWNWYLWYCGALHTHRISRKKAALMIGIVFVLQVAYLFHLLFFSFL